MINKVLGRMEALKGFIQISTKSRNELIGDMPTPCRTFVNGEIARLDNYGRLWSPWLKGRFPVGCEVQLSKTQEGFQIEAGMNKSINTVPTIECKSETELLLQISKIKCRIKAKFMILDQFLKSEEAILFHLENWSKIFDQLITIELNKPLTDKDILTYANT
jgi:hypothetical protein